ncbi:hypothetical protein THF1C08_230079 [Vibrio jasicida]|uniref:Uncharacterized protein n=1 Tax=Vibrio jasicida TaxID=766224 RepID=A0AAU9QPE4_9VIBR|nr:hypothetical protein THF1C08_230079 [Vibrio jasicida]CAH1591126.1 hypothetical protein THF1A12_230077 [Vibrio jasicida]
MLGKLSKIFTTLSYSASYLIVFTYQTNLNCPLDLMIIILNNRPIETTQQLSNYHEKDTNLCSTPFYYRV